MYIEFRSIADMNNTIIQKMQILPHDIDLVVGIPRSGMLPANLIALYLNKPFADIDSFVDGRVYASGCRGSYINQDNSRKVLIVDDSISSGSALEKAKNKLKSVASKYNLLYAAIYATSKGSKMVDYFFEIIDVPRVFQWNLFHHKVFITKSCFDIDGVLCVDPPMDDDGPIYSEYIANAPALYIPSLEIDTLVSCRLEKYRNITEEWLKKNNVKYKHLVMLPFKTKVERVAWGKHGEYKGKIYKKSDNIFFVESSLTQAHTISKVSGKPVFCTETMEMVIDHPVVNKAKQKTRLRLYTYKKAIYMELRSLLQTFKIHRDW